MAAEEQIYLEEYGAVSICRAIGMPAELITSEIIFNYVVPSIVQVYCDGELEFTHPAKTGLLSTWFGEQDLKKGCCVPLLEDLRRREPEDNPALLNLQRISAEVFARNLVYGSGPFGPLEFDELCPSVTRIDDYRVYFAGHFGQDEYCEKLARPIRNILAIEPGVHAKHTVDQQLKLYNSDSLFQYHAVTQNEFIGNFLMGYHVLSAKQVFTNYEHELRESMERLMFRPFAGQAEKLTREMIAANRYSYDLVVYASYQQPKLDAMASKEVLANAYQLLRPDGALMLGFPTTSPPGHVSMADLMYMAMAAGFPGHKSRLHIGSSNLSNTNLPGYAFMFKE